MLTNNVANVLRMKVDVILFCCLMQLKLREGAYELSLFIMNFLMFMQKLYIPEVMHIRLNNMDREGGGKITFRSILGRWVVRIKGG